MKEGEPTMRKGSYSEELVSIVRFHVCTHTDRPHTMSKLLTREDFQESLDAQTCPPGNSGQVAIVTSKEVASLRHEMLFSVLSVQALVGL